MGSQRVEHDWETEQQELIQQQQYVNVITLLDFWLIYY